MILIFNYHRIPTFILHHQLKTAFKNEFLKLGMVCCFFFFALFFLFVIAFFTLEHLYPE